MKENFTRDFNKAEKFFMEKISFCESPFELKEKIQNDRNNINLIDVREYDDYIDGHIPYATHIPFNNLDGHLSMLHKDKVNIIYSYCPYCKKALKAAHYFATKSYPTMVLEGGIMIWKELGFDIVKTSSNIDR